MFVAERRQSTASQATVATNFSQNAHSGPYLEGNLKLQDKIECEDIVLCCRFGKEGTVLAVGLSNGCIKIYSINPFQCLYSLQDTVQGKPQAVTQVEFRVCSPDDKPEVANTVVASYASGMVKFWHYTTGQCTHTINEPREQTFCLAFNKDGSKFITAGDDEKIYLYDGETKNRISTHGSSYSNKIMDGHKSRVLAAKFHPNHPNVFLTGGWDNTIQIWDGNSEHAIRLIYGPHICGDGVDIDPVHNHILTASWRKTDTVQIWDFGTGKKIRDVPPDPMNESLLYCCQWYGKERIICGGSEKHMARVIDRGTLSTTGQLVDLPGAVYCMDNDRQGAFPLIAVGSENCIYLVRPFFVYPAFVAIIEDSPSERDRDIL